MDDSLTNEQKVKIFKSVFKGREDAFGEGQGQSTKQKLTDDIITSHLKGQRRIGQYPLSPDILDGSGVWWSALDIDTAGLTAAIKYNSNLAELGISGYIERSSGVNHPDGLHLWVFFTKAVEARVARALMQYAVNGENIEVFPKQTTIKDQNGYGYGNYVNLPLFGTNVPDKRSVFLNPEIAYEPYANQWAFLQSIERVSPDLVKDLIESGELEVETNVVMADDVPDSTDGGGEYADMLPCVGQMMAGVGAGRRDQVAFTLAKHWRAEKKLSMEATLGILLNWDQKNEPPLGSKTIKAKVQSAYNGKGGAGYTSYGCENKLIHPFCNKENCPIFAEHTKEMSSPYFRGNTFIPPRLGNELIDEFSFVYAGGQLYVYGDGVHSPIGAEFIKTKCREKLKEEARVNRINEVIAHVTDLNHVKPDELNTYKDLMNLNNCMLNWRTGEQLPHSEKYLSTIRIPVNYNPNEECPTVKEFLLNTIPRDCIPIAEELFGYCLIPDTRYETAFMLTGTGANGKSTFINLIEAFVGEDNVCKIPLQELSDNRFKRADLYGKLVNVFADLDAKALQSSTYFKTVVSGDGIDAERKNRDPFYFKPFSRLVFSANEIPRSPDRSFAYYRRWCIIEFRNVFKGANADKKIIARLTQPAELSGLLNIALAGLRRLLENDDFSKSKTVEEALEAYKKANDTAIAFISDRCKLDADSTIERTKLYEAYERYCESEGFKPISRQAFYSRVRAQAVGEKKLSKKRLFVGIRLDNC